MYHISPANVYAGLQFLYFIDFISKFDFMAIQTQYFLFFIPNCWSICCFIADHRRLTIKMNNV